MKIRPLFCTDILRPVHQELKGRAALPRRFNINLEKAIETTEHGKRLPTAGKRVLPK